MIDQSAIEISFAGIPDRNLAITATSCAADATAELIRYAREGAAAGTNYGLAEGTIGQLAEALKLAIEIEANAMAAVNDDAEGLSLMNQLSGACVKFLEDWS